MVAMSVTPAKSTASLIRFVRASYFASLLLLAVSLLALFHGPFLDSINDPDAAVATFTRRDHAIARVRDALNAGSNAARTFLLSWSPDREANYQRALDKFQTEAAASVDEVEKERMLGDSPLEALRHHFAAAADALNLIRSWTEAERRNQSQTFFSGGFANVRRPISTVVAQLAETNQAQLAATVQNRNLELLRARGRLAALVFLPVLSLIATGLSHLTYERKLAIDRAAHYDEIVAAKAGFERLSSRLFDIQEEERKRLSRELHDGIGQILTALRMEISHVQSKSPHSADNGGALTRARALAGEAIQITRDISLLLRPTVLDDLGLEPALRWHAEEFQRRTRIPCVFHAVHLRDDLPEAWKTCVYRVVQEGLTNCQKHSSAARVRIHAEQKPGLLEVAIEDDGRGFDLNKTGPRHQNLGLGLLGMRERAYVLGGTLEVQSAPG